MRTHNYVPVHEHLWAHLVLHVPGHIGLHEGPNAARDLWLVTSTVGSRVRPRRRVLWMEDQLHEVVDELWGVDRQLDGL